MMRVGYLISTFNDLYSHDIGLIYPHDPIIETYSIYCTVHQMIRLFILIPVSTLSHHRQQIYSVQSYYHYSNDEIADLVVILSTFKDGHYNLSTS
jgi:hypothetical protein